MSENGVYPDASDALQSPLDREMLAAHFQGYELEPLITVALNPVELVNSPSTASTQSWKGRSA